MKKGNIYLISTVCLCALLFGCNQPKKAEKGEEQITVEMNWADEHIPTAIQAMQHSLKDELIEYRGKTYQCVVERTPDANLDIVADERGVRYYDNTIRVKLSEKNGRVILNKVYKKEDFRGILNNEKFLSKAILEGMVFYRTAPGGFLFSASVAYPQTDIFVPIRLLVSPSGSVSIQLEEGLDELPEEDTEK
ncbi:MAG: DUF4738 domain-containing protein [Bacteroidales bacterium]|nr:DUF4738 domain-containing protein [Bacteroidales bacterium]